MADSVAPIGLTVDAQGRVQANYWQELARTPVNPLGGGDFDVTASSEATADTVADASGAGASSIPLKSVPTLVEFFAPAFHSPAGSHTLTLFAWIDDGAGSPGSLGWIFRRQIGASADQGSIYGAAFFTPPADDSYIVQIKGFIEVAAALVRIRNGLGGTGAYAPAYVRVSARQ